MHPVMKVFFSWLVSFLLSQIKQTNFCTSIALSLLLVTSIENRIVKTLKAGKRDSQSCYRKNTYGGLVQELGNIDFVSFNYNSAESSRIGTSLPCVSFFCGIHLRQEECVGLSVLSIPFVTLLSIKYTSGGLTGKNIYLLVTQKLSDPNWCQRTLAK